MNQVHLWPGHVLYLGPTHDPHAHRHYAMQIVVALDGTLDVELARDTTVTRTRAAGSPRRVEPASRSARVVSAHDSFRSRAVCIPAQTAHRVRCEGPVAILLVESDVLDTAVPQKTHTLAQCDDLVRACAGLMDRSAAHNTVAVRDALLLAFGHDVRATPSARDPRVALMLRRIESSEEPALAEAAAGAGLSIERCRHLFRESMGLPFSRYRLWRRVIAAARSCSEGTTATTSAHASGFADSAHFSRAFRQTFGLAPSTVFRHETQFFVHADLSADAESPQR